MHRLLPLELGAYKLEMVDTDQIVQARVHVCRDCWEVTASHITADPQVVRVRILNRGTPERQHCYEVEDEGSDSV